jgi:outer membrane protein TolC
MSRPRGRLAVVALAIWLAGCATSSVELAPDRPDRPWAPATTGAGAIVPGAIIPGATAPGGGQGYVLPSNPEAAALPAPPAFDATAARGLPELIDIAESANPATRIAWNDARRVALAAGIAESAYLPKIAASAVGAYQASSGRNAALGFGAAGNGSAEGTISAVSLNWLLFDFGERAAVVDAAEQASIISNIAFTAAHQQVIYDVSQAFYAHAAARARTRTAEQSLKNAQAVETAAGERSRHGVGTVLDVAQARQATAQARLALVQATGGEEDAYLRLIAAMGISPLTKMAIAELPERKLSPAVESSVESIVSEALSRRPDMLAAYAAQKASLANVEAAKAEFLPKLFVSASGAYSSGGIDLPGLPAVGPQGSSVTLSGNHLGGSILAGVTVPLYDGGTRSAMLAQAKAEAENAGAKLARTRDEAVRQVVLSDNALRTSLAAHDAAEALAAAAQTTFDAALAAYRNGLGSATEATIAETQLLQARNATADSYSAALSAAATLALATGSLGTAPP